MTAYTDLCNLLNQTRSEIKVSPPDGQGVRNVVAVLNGEATYLGTIADGHNGDTYGYEVETVSGEKTFTPDPPLHTEHAAAFHTALAHIIRANNVP